MILKAFQIPAPWCGWGLDRNGLRFGLQHWGEFIQLWKKTLASDDGSETIADLTGIREIIHNAFWDGGRGSQAKRNGEHNTEGNAGEVESDHLFQR